MPRRPKPPIPEADKKQESKQAIAANAKPAADEEKPLRSKPGTRGPDGKRVPPPPHPRGKPFPKKKVGPEQRTADSLLRFDSEIRLRTRSECERVCEHIANWLKAGKIDPNLANALLNAVGKVLQSKTATQEMELKVADREMLRRLQEMEQKQTNLEEHFVQQDAEERKLQ